MGWAKEISLALNSGVDIVKLPKIKIQIRWEPPQLSWTKRNVDSAAKGNPGPAGGGRCCTVRMVTGLWASLPIWAHALRRKLNCWPYYMDLELLGAKELKISGTHGF